MTPAEQLVLVVPHSPGEAPGPRLRSALAAAVAGRQVATVVERAEQLRPQPGQRLLFVLELGASGVNLEVCRLLRRLREEPELLSGCLGALLADGHSQLYTKAAARQLALAANLAGCAFIGRPLTEGQAELANFRVQSHWRGVGVAEAYQQEAREMVERLLTTTPPSPGGELLVLHASNRETSNTLLLWNLVKAGLDPARITEINLRNGAIDDCSACSYRACRHFGENGSCFYGGPVSEEVYPALERCHSLLLLCPNYNDAVSANLAACINRLTAMFRRRRFYEKRLHAIIVSGYSGSDIVAEQLIAALNMNKSFFLPPRFCLLELANEPGEILSRPGLAERAAEFAKSI